MAEELDPFPTHIFSRVVRSGLHVESDPKRVRADMEKLLFDKPDWLSAMETLTLAYVYLDDYANATDVAETWKEKSHGDPAAISNLATVHALAGRTEDARDLLKTLEMSDAYVDIAGAAYVYVTLGDIDRAFERLDRAYDERTWKLILVRTIPYWEIYRDRPEWIAFRTDPRYFDLIERMNYPPLPPEHPGYEDQVDYRTKNAKEAVLAE